MIRIERLKKTYKEVIALKGVDLHVAEGELFGYLGPNGAGKTTTIRILLGLCKPSSGDAFLNGAHIERQAVEAKSQCGLVPQSINLDRELTLFENLDIHGRLFHMSRGQRTERIDQLLEYVGLEEKRDVPCNKLSGGMKRRAMIARALVHSPRILFLDEPTVGLDANIRRRIWALIKRIQQEGTTVFLTTHYIEEAEFLAERVAFVNEGEIVALDRPQVLMSRLGSWAMDAAVDGDIETSYFATREEAQHQAAGQGGAFTVRRVNLEDAFLALTGTKIEK